MKTLITILILLISTPMSGQGTIFSPGKTYGYAIEYASDRITTLDTVKITATGKPWTADPDKQLEIIINYNLKDLDTAIFAGLANIGWVEADTTGAVDNEDFCWFHPPRHNQYRILELAPFPRVEFPLYVDKTYSRFLFIGEGWGDISNTKVAWKYKVTRQIGDNWGITAQAIPDNQPDKTSQLEFTFNKKAGFIDLRYTLYDGTTIAMKRI